VWASAHELPFPEFPASYRKQIIDTLDYPPAGSPKGDRGWAAERTPSGATRTGNRA